MEEDCLNDQFSLLLLKLETLFDMDKDPPITTLESLLQLGLLLGNLALFENLLWSAQFKVLKTSWLSNSRLHAEDMLFSLPSLVIFLALEEQFWQYFEHFTTCTIVLFLFFVVTWLKQSEFVSFWVLVWLSLEVSPRIHDLFLFILKQLSFSNLFVLLISCSSKFESL